MGMPVINQSFASSENEIRLDLVAGLLVNLISMKAKLLNFGVGQLFCNLHHAHHTLGRLNQ